MAGINIDVNLEAIAVVRCANGYAVVCTVRTTALLDADAIVRLHLFLADNALHAPPVPHWLASYINAPTARLRVMSAYRQDVNGFTMIDPAFLVNVSNGGLDSEWNQDGNRDQWRQSIPQVVPRSLQVGRSVGA